MRFSLPLSLRFRSAQRVLWGDSYQRYLFGKRALDLALCLLAMPVALVIMAILAIAIRLDSPGPIFFIQDRLGKDRRRFRMYKFRTFKCDYDDCLDREYMKDFVAGRIGQGSTGKPLGKPFKLEQITRLGRILRKTSLDEIPQIFNILRGEMSFVGPRPNVLWEVEAYEDWHKKRLEALPGITGLAQVRGRSDISFDAIVRYDIEYIKKQSLMLDLQILWWTAWWVFSGRGAG